MVTSSTYVRSKVMDCSLLHSLFSCSVNRYSRTCKEVMGLILLKEVIRMPEMLERLCPKIPDGIALRCTLHSCDRNSNDLFVEPSLLLRLRCRFRSLGLAEELIRRIIIPHIPKVLSHWNNERADDEDCNQSGILSCDFEMRWRDR